MPVEIVNAKVKLAIISTGILNSSFYFLNLFFLFRSKHLFQQISSSGSRVGTDSSFFFAYLVK